MSFEDKWETLKARLRDLGIRDAHISEGSEWNNITPEERVDELLKIIDAIEAGLCVPLVLGDSSDEWYESSETWDPSGFTVGDS